VSRRAAHPRTSSSDRRAANAHRADGQPRPHLQALLIVVIVALVLSAVLTGDRLASQARAMEYGPLRTVAVVAATPVEWLNHLLRIDRLTQTLKQAVAPVLTPDEVAEEPGTPPGSVVPTGSPDASQTPPPTEPGGNGGSGEAPAGASYSNPSPTAVSPLTVVVSGDSMTEAFGKYLRSDLAETGVATGIHDFRFSSGLARPDFFDWPAHLRELLVQHDPDLVILMVGANDGQDIKVDGEVLKFGSEKWIAVYAQRVRDTMDMLAVDGRRVYWVGQPIARSETYSAKMKTLDGVYAAEAEGRENVIYLDTWELFSAADGSYSAYLPGGTGEQQLMRADDGIHLSVAGAHRLTDHVMDAIERDYGITR